MTFFYGDFVGRLKGVFTSGAWPFVTQGSITVNGCSNINYGVNSVVSLSSLYFHELNYARFGSASRK